MRAVRVAEDNSSPQCITYYSNRPNMVALACTDLFPNSARADLPLPIHPIYAQVLTCDWNRMKRVATNPDSERFRSGADRYAAYLETPEGRLRLDLAFANLLEFLPPAKRPLHALDLGCGT